jgi:hypothetical protein
MKSFFVKATTGGITKSRIFEAESEQDALQQARLHPDMADLFLPPLPVRQLADRSLAEMPRVVIREVIAEVAR